MTGALDRSMLRDVPNDGRFNVPCCWARNCAMVCPGLKVRRLSSDYCSAIEFLLFEIAGLTIEIVKCPYKQK